MAGLGYFYGVHLLVAVAVSFIALFGLAVETGVIMVIYLNDAMQQLVAAKGNSGETISKQDLRDAVFHGAAKRLRPKLMGHWRIRRALKPHGLRAQQPRSFVPRTIDFDPAVRAMPNRLLGRWAPTAPNRV